MFRWIYFHDLATGGAVCLLSMLLLTFLPSKSIALVLACLLFVLPVFAITQTSRRALQALNQFCDPEPLLELSQRDLQRRFFSGQRLLPRVNAGAALHALGRFQEALEYLDPACIPQHPANNVYLTALIWLNRSAVMYDLKQPEEMAHCLALAEKALSSSLIPQSQRPDLTHVFNQNRLAYRMLTEGYSPEVEAGFQAALSQAKTEHHRVIGHSSLAECALAREDLAAAREHLEYVIAHGNKLYARTQAIQLWAQQDFPPSTEPPA